MFDTPDDGLIRSRNMQCDIRGNKARLNIVVKEGFIVPIYLTIFMTQLKLNYL
jgi:hypothetical protein